MLAHGEMQPRRENRVTLDPERTDEWGMPIARIACAHSEADTPWPRGSGRRWPSWPARAA